MRKRDPYDADGESEDDWGEFPKREFKSWEESKYLLKIASNRLLAIISISDESVDSDATAQYFSDEDDACAEESGGLRLSSEEGYGSQQNNQRARGSGQKLGGDELCLGTLFESTL